MKLGNVDGVGVSMLGQPGAVLVIDRTATIGCGDLELAQGDAEMKASGRLDNRPDPMVDRRDHRASQGCGGSEQHPPIGGARHLEGLLGAADTRTAEGGTGLHEPTRPNQPRCQALAFLDSAPRLVLGNERRPATALATARKGGESKRA